MGGGGGFWGCGGCNDAGQRSREKGTGVGAWMVVVVVGGGGDDAGQHTCWRGRV